jgi:MFS family permease
MGGKEMTGTTVKVAARAKGLGGLMAGFFGVQLFVNIANGGVANSLVPNLIAQLDEEHKVSILGIAGAVAAVGALITQPLWGMLSDGTRSRLGRRVPWILGGIVGLALTFVGLATVGSVVWVVVLAAAVQIFYSMVAGPLSAIIPDRTPVERRGAFSALGSLGVFIGGLIGVVIASQFVSKLSIGFVVMGALILICATPFAFPLRDRGLGVVETTRVAKSLTDTLKGFFVDPRKHPDFFWAFIARLVLIVGYWSIVSFQLYILDDYIGLGLSKANEIYPLTTAVLGVGIIVALVPSGIISDRIGRRKPFVIVASVIVALSAIVPIIWPTVPGAIVSIGIGGLGFGVYLAVDQALMTQVLPNASDAGKDLGVLNIAQAGGQVVAPLVASVVIGIAGYPALYGFASVLAALAALAILPIKSVR